MDYEKISIRQKQADTLFNEMGMTLTTAVNIFIRQAVLEQAIPFRIYVDSDRAIALKAKESGAILVTGNTKHYPTESFIMTPSDFLAFFNKRGVNNYLFMQYCVILSIIYP